MRRSQVMYAALAAFVLVAVWMVVHGQSTRAFTGTVVVGGNPGGFGRDWVPGWLRRLAPWLPAPPSHDGLGSVSVVATDH